MELMIGFAMVGAISVMISQSITNSSNHRLASEKRMRGLTLHHNFVALMSSCAFIGELAERPENSAFKQCLRNQSCGDGGTLTVKELSPNWADPQEFLFSKSSMGLVGVTMKNKTAIPGTLMTPDEVRILIPLHEHMEGIQKIPTPLICRPNQYLEGIHVRGGYPICRDIPR